MLMNSGSIATLRRRVGLLDQGEEDFALPNPMAQGPLAGGNPFNQPFQPAQQGPSSPQATSGGDGLMSRIYNTMRPDLTPAQEYLLSPDEQKRAKGGLLGRVLKQAATLGAYTPSMQAQDRARSMIAEQGMVKERQQAADLESRQGKFRQMAQQILGDPTQLDSETLNMRLRQIDAVGRSLGVNDPAFANVLDNIQPREAAKATMGNLSWRDNVLGADNKPYQVGYDPTGKEVVRIPQFVKPDDPQKSVARQDAEFQRMAQRAGPLSTSFQRETERHQVVAESLTTISGLRQPALQGDGAAQHMLVFALMKLADPGSAVRQDERADTKNAANVPERLRAAWNALLGGGGKLSPATVQDFLSTVDSTAASRIKDFDALKKQFETRAKILRVDPELVVSDYFENIRGNGVKPPAGKMPPRPTGVSDAEWNAYLKDRGFIK